MPDTPVRCWRQIVLFRTLLLSHTRFSDEVKHVLANRCSLSMMQFDMLAELGGHARMRMTDLSSKLITSPSSATRVAKSLEGMGLLVRERAAESEREVEARLTKEGEAFFAEHFLALATDIKALVDERLGAEEQVQLTTLLTKLGATES